MGGKPMDKLLIVDSNIKFCEKMKNFFISKDYFDVIFITNKISEGHSILVNERPGMLITDIFFDEGDVFDFIKTASEITIKHKPGIVVLSAIKSEVIFNQTIQSGADYYVLKPFDNECLWKRVKEINDNGKNNRNIYYKCFEGLKARRFDEDKEEYADTKSEVFNADKYVSNLLNKFGLTCNNKGSQYLRLAIIRTIELIDKDSHDIVFSHDVYRVIARHIGMNQRAVQQSIRNAINNALNTENKEVLEWFYGSSNGIAVNEINSISFIKAIAEKALEAKLTLT
jgi:two-component system response regulator (stage 0 sporulation protein A)